jgi:group I intron endonuclease
MNIYSIYKATNKINSKVYIGIDKNWPTRKYAHKSRAKHDTGFHFHKAIRKYGWDNFDWEIIYQTDDYDDLKLNEIKFISQYNSFVEGYNKTFGGDGSPGKLQSEENKREQSKRRAEYNKQSKWYNNGKENTLSTGHPGQGWVLGRLNQKPTTKGNKWFNNGIEQRLTKNPPDGWIKGMLPKKKRL